MSRPLRVLVESTPRRVYVSALDWPGLARGAKTEAQPIELLLVALPRFERIASVRPSDGSPIGGKKWPPRYAARRIAWHAIDHAWEIEDRTDPA